MKRYVVEITFAPEKDMDDSMERIAFSTFSAAMDFARRQRKKPNVRCVNIKEAHNEQ